MSNELTPHQPPSEQMPATQETGERLPIEPRIVVFGSVGSGALEVETALRENLEARNLDIAVHQARLVTAIDTNFFGRYPVDQTSHPAIETPAQPSIEAPAQPTTDTKRGLLAGLGNLLTRGSKNEVSVAPTPTPAVVEVRPDSLPSGVIIFPEMRQRTPDGSVAMTVETPYDRIIELCEANGVPYVRAQRIEDAAQGIGRLFQQTALPGGPAQIPGQ